jgi:hypothetical protein
MSLKKITGNETPRPLRGKTAKSNRLVRFVDLNESLKEVEENFIQLPSNPTTGDALVFNGTEWVPGSVGGEWTGGTSYILVKGEGTPTENAQELQSAYDLAKTMSPSANNRITVIAAAGLYGFFGTPFIMDTEYIDLVSLDGNRSIIFNGSGTISITANDVFVKGVSVLIGKNFTIGDDLNLLKIENCYGGALSFGGSSNIVSGTFINCEGSGRNFGFNGVASGTFINCKSGTQSFGGGGGTASGTFTNCLGGEFSFGDNGILSGKLYYCRLTTGTFETVSGSGRTYYCIDGNGDPNNQ